MPITKKRNPKFNKLRQGRDASFSQLDDELSVFTQPEEEVEEEVEVEVEKRQKPSRRQQNVITEIETGVRGINAQDDPLVKKIVGDASPKDMAAFNEKNQRLANEADLRDILRDYGGGQKAVEQVGAEQLLRVIRKEKPVLEKFFKQKYGIK